jgi:putative membrane protein
VHAFLARYRRAFAEDRNTHSARFFRILNEAPTLLMAIIVIMIIVRPGT